MFQVNVYLPNKVVLKDHKVSELKIPTEKGQIQVLPEHTHVISNLDIGILEMGSGKDVQKIAIAFGVCKILKNEVTILTQVAEYPKDIDKKSVEEEIKSLNSSLQKTDNQTNSQVEKIRNDLAIAKMKLAIAN